MQSPTRRHRLQIRPFTLISLVESQHFRVRCDAPGTTRLAINVRPPVVVPRQSAISTTVLLERKGKPVMVLVNARFRALGRRIAGPSNTRFDSTGRFFFQRVGGSWKIVSYDVRRSDDRVDKTLPSSPGAPDASPTGAP